MALLLEPSKKQLEVILEKIGETEKSLEDGLDYLQSWIKSQSCIKYNCDRRLLVLFLRGCKNRPELAKYKLSTFLQARGAIPTNNPGAFHERIFKEWDTDNPEFIRTTKVIEICPMPRLTSDGHRITIHRVMPHKYADIFINEIIKYTLMIGELRLLRETTISGDIFVFDGKDISPGILYRLATNGNMIQEVLRLIQNAYPQRLHQIHIINSSPVIQAIVSIFKACVKEKIRNRYIFHASFETLTDYISSTDLPVEYGGCEESISTLSEKWLKELKQNSEILSNVSSVASAGKDNIKNICNNNNQDFGMNGTFKSLSID